MRGNYVTLSLENHLFFCRIMKEHSLFLMAGFLGKNDEYIKKADWFKGQFEELLNDVIALSRGRVREKILDSGEIVTEFTMDAEKRTSCLTGIDIDCGITEKEKRMANDCHKMGKDRGNYNMVTPQERIRIGEINRRALRLVDGLIEFKEDILKNVAEGCIFTANYPLLIEHILREAKLYRSMISELERRGTITSQSMLDMEVFWNQIMMEHAMFIRGLLDPCETELIKTAHGYAKDYRRLLEEAKSKDCMVNDDLRERTKQKTKEYRDFKAAGTKGITKCEIASIILPLLADHVLREANHYLRLLG